MWLGGGVHQIGFNAKAAYHALKNNIDRIKIDHENTQLLLEEISPIEEIIINPLSGSTNMVQFDISRLKSNSDEFLGQCQKLGLLLFPWLPDTIRAVIHKDISSAEVVAAASILKQVIKNIGIKKI
jgi:threonine aldolase